MVMRYAVVTGRAESDQISSLRGAIKSHQAKHLASNGTHGFRAMARTMPVYIS